MSEELNVAVEPVETTTAPEPITSSPEPVEEKFPEFKETSEKSVLRQQIEHAAKTPEERKRGNPYKAADGKFTKKPLEAASKTDALAASPESEATSQVLEPQTPAIPMPKSWPKEKQAIWDALPTAAKEWLDPHAAQTDQNFEKYKGQLKTYEDVIAPYQHLLTASGRTAPEAIHQALSWHAALSNEQTRGQAFEALLQAYPHQLGSSAADPAQQPLSDPRVDQVSHGLAQMQQRLAEAERREAEAQMRQTSEHVAKWATEKPHYENVRQDMGLRIKAAAEIGREMSLDEAYEASIWANPEIRDTLMKSQFEAQQKAAQEKARKAQLASVSATSRAPSGPANGTGQPTKLRDQIKDAFRENQGAGRA